MNVPHAIVTPLKAIRMLLDGSGVLVRAERWQEIEAERERLRKLIDCAWAGQCGQCLNAAHELLELG